jgi:hypothetical protein
MPDRPEPASQQPHRPATASMPRQYPPTVWPQTGPHPAGSGVPLQPQGPYPNIPLQWSGPAYESLLPQWDGPPPAGLDAPLPIPKTHPIRNVLLGITGLLVAIIVLGSAAPSAGFAPSTGSSPTVEAWRDSGGLDRLGALSRDLSAVGNAQRAGDIEGVGMACLSLWSDAESAEAYMPIPDPEAQTHWAAALAHLAHASTACVMAVRSQDAAKFIRASHEMDAVPADVSQVITRLSALNN